jgi:hypothetical protein
MWKTPLQRFDSVIAGYLAYDGKHVLLGQDEVVGVVELELGTSVLGEEHFITNLHIQWDAVAIVVPAALTSGYDGAALWLLLGGVRQHDAAGSHLFATSWLDHEAITEWLEI